MNFNVVIIGSGVGLKHLEALNEIDQTKVIAICEKNRSRRVYLKKKFTNIEIISDYKKIFNIKDNIDLISIASYDSDHFKQIKSLSTICRNFIVEKPMVQTPHELKELRKIVKKKKLKIFSNLVLREVELFKFIKKNISKNKIYNIEADYLWGRIYKLFEWRSKEKKYSLTLGASIHMIDIVNWLVDDMPVSVFTKGNKISTKKTKFKKSSFLTHLFSYKNGLIVKISANAASAHPHFHEIKVFQKNKTLISNLNNQLIITRNLSNKNKFKIQKLKLPYPDKQNRKKLIKSFVKSIKNNRSPNISFKYLCNLMQICFFADLSLVKKKEIKIKFFKS